MTIVVISLVIRMVSMMITAALSHRYMLEGYFAKGLLLFGLFVTLFRGSLLRAIEMHMLRIGRTDDLVNAYKLIQSAPMGMLQDVIIILGAVLAFRYYYRKAKKLHGGK